MARIPEQRTNSLASEVKTITEAGPLGADFTDSSQPGPPAEQQALLGSSGSHTKWPKPPAEKRAEVRCLPRVQMGQGGGAPEGAWAGATFLEPRSPQAELWPLTPVPQENRYVVRLSESNLVI